MSEANGAADGDDMAGRSEMSDDALDAALAGAFKAHPFDARFAAKVAAAARASAPAAPRREPLRLAPARPERTEARRLSPRTFAIAAGLLAAAGLALFLLRPGNEPAPRASVTVASLLDGDGALVIRGANTSSGLAGEKMPLRDGDRVRAERIAVRVALADGSEVKLHPETTIEVHGDHVEMIGAGQLFAMVTPRAHDGPAPAFVTFDGEPVEVAVRGTKFGVQYDGTEIATSVLEGTVEVRSGMMTSLVRAGERFGMYFHGSDKTFMTSGSVPANLDRDLGWAVGAIARPRPPEPPQPPVVQPVTPPPVSSPVTTEPPTRSSNADLPIGGPAPPLQGQ